jgi:hypothetical protein
MQNLTTGFSSATNQISSFDLGPGPGPVHLYLRLVCLCWYLTDPLIYPRSFLDTFPINDGSICLSSLRNLKVQFINLTIYQTLLSTCSNLYYFQLSIFTSEECLLTIPIHNNLRRLRIKVGDVVWPWNDHLFNSYLSCLPNLEDFSIHRLIYISRITESFFNYDWLASIVSSHLPLLHRLRFYLHCSQSKKLSKYDTEKTINRLKQTFINIHNNQYRSRLIIERS